MIKQLINMIMVIMVLTLFANIHIAIEDLLVYSLDTNALLWNHFNI